MIIEAFKKNVFPAEMYVDVMVKISFSCILVLMKSC